MKPKLNRFFPAFKLLSLTHTESQVSLHHHHHDSLTSETRSQTARPGHGRQQPKAPKAIAKLTVTLTGTLLHNASILGRDPEDPFNFWKAFAGFRGPTGKAYPLHKRS